MEDDGGHGETDARGARRASVRAARDRRREKGAGGEQDYLLLTCEGGALSLFSSILMPCFAFSTNAGSRPLPATVSFRNAPGCTTLLSLIVTSPTSENQKSDSALMPWEAPVSL